MLESKNARNASVVVTGIGIVSPLGCGTELVWRRLLDGRSGIRAVTRFEVSDLPSQIAGVVPSLGDDAEGGFVPDAVVAPREAKRMTYSFAMPWWLLTRP